MLDCIFQRTIERILFHEQKRYTLFGSINLKYWHQVNLYRQKVDRLVAAKAEERSECDAKMCDFCFLFLSSLS